MNTIANAAAVKATFQDWKWKAATAANGKTIGLGLDAGPEAFCYRTDMFKAAGLPTDPTTVGAKLRTWADLITMGKQYMASPSKPANSAFIDGPSTVFSSEVYQHHQAYSDTSGKAIPSTSDGVAAAWKDAVAAAQAGITAKFQPFNGAGIWLCQELVRRDLLPLLDAGVHPGSGGHRRHGQVEHHLTSGWIHQLGRLLDGHPQGRQERSGRD